MSAVPEFVNLFDGSITALFRSALRISRRNPGTALFLIKTLYRQRRAIRRRHAALESGVHVPPVIIASVTERCNLHCQGCYSQAHCRAPEAEMDAGRLVSLFNEARNLGVSFILLAGGEPLTRPELLEIAAGVPEIVFPLFTNGLLIDPALTKRLRKMKNIIPVISIEGREELTDSRRGMGTYARAMRAVDLLSGAGVFFGVSVTLTNENFDTVMDEGFVHELEAKGCRLFIYVDYVPVAPGTEGLLLTEKQRNAAAERLAVWGRESPALFIALPGDEEKYGGCLAAGRGFVHISADGRIEPCPFSPFSDVNVKDISLREALQSDLLQKIRESADELTETQGGCVLWAKRDWVRSLLG